MRDDTTNDVSLLKSYLDVVERPFTEEFHFLRGEFSHDVRALCVARCSFSRFSQHTQVVGVGVGVGVCCLVRGWVGGPFFSKESPKDFIVQQAFFFVFFFVLFQKFLSSSQKKNEKKTKKKKIRLLIKILLKRTTTF